MIDEVIDYEKEQLKVFEKNLKKVAELNAFIKVYGSLYDSFYNTLICNINNICEHYLDTYNFEVINKLYSLYTNLRKENKKEKEIFEQLRKFIYTLPAINTSETKNRIKIYK